ncbi:ArsR/SmtB family transcription factor [Halobaculum magnesiiphilum]|uniref:Metalloregulator ArsR/SmtB family transcription factor n=1 Tax=Halobaculum magnesiiphilum TaxID=1017351 RepID=A0A8T8WFH8_9EURY|nr:metalloregulator ArsR/SmtB family transcription factor [Halobaculum magnesiiphilum]QZP38608.1 metalloregulator ArsR/SmtB family transcription factor [Halobaculum magnesiiphilum]
MATTDRLERLIADEVGECCAADVDDRLDDLHALAERARVVDGGEAAELDALSALGSDTRYRLARLLAAADGELCVCELEPLVEVSSSAVSHALSTLTDAGLLVRRKEGKWRYYDTTERAEALLDALDATRAADE